ncbi:hypothetical protein G6F37_010313 [Rhizopus arrhizus]|nr:hypothetical protein G6F37_010313 [Rhizopus arrhizus]
MMAQQIEHIYYSNVVASMIKKCSSLQSILEPVDLVELLGIVDLTLPDAAAILQHQVNSIWCEKLELPVWKPESAYEECTHRIMSSNANSHLL